jgi:antitoxin CcdA
MPFESHKRNSTRKRSGKLMLSDDLVSQAKDMATNLLDLDEQLLAGDVIKHNNARQEKAHRAGDAAKAWNAFNEKVGSFADDYSTL